MNDYFPDIRGLSEPEPMPKRMLSDEQVGQLAEELRGTVGTVDTAAEHLFDLSEDELTLEDCRALDDQVFLCTTCGWWCETSELCEDDDTGENVCQDCWQDD